MIDIKLRRIQFVTGIIVIVVGFFFIGCASKPLSLKLKSCDEKAGAEVSCQTFEFTGKASLLPF